MGWVDPWLGLGWVGYGSRIFVSGLGRGTEMGDLRKNDVSRLSAEKVESVELMHWGCMQG